MRQALDFGAICYPKSRIDSRFENVPTFREAAIGLAQDALCTLLDANADAAEYFRGLRGRIGPFNFPIGEYGARNSRALANLACPNDVPPGGYPPSYPPGAGAGGSGSPSVSGDCPVGYRLRANITYTPTTGPPAVTERFNLGDNNTYQGPIGAPTANVSSGNRFFLTFANISASLLGPFFIGDIPTFEIDHERVDGQPDICDSNGNPIDPGDNPPILPPATPTDIIYDDENGAPITEPVVVQPLPPIINEDGDIILITEISSETWNITVNNNVSCDTQCIQIPEVPGIECCEPRREPDNDPPDNDEPEEPENIVERIVGAVITTTTIPTQIEETRVLGQDNGPDLYLPDLGSVAFSKRAGLRTVWSTPIRIQFRQQEIICPFPGGADSVKGVTRASVDWTITPVRAQITDDD